MKLSLIIPVILVGCAHQAQALVPSSVPEDNMPASAHVIYCSNPDMCFESAALDCSPDVTNKQHLTPGEWKQVAEPGFAFPALVQDNNGWHMWIVCSTKK